ACSSSGVAFSRPPSSMTKPFHVLFAALSFLWVHQASAEVGQVIPMGDLERWAAFTLGADGPNDRLSDNSVVQGDFGSAGNGNLTLSESSTINGDLYYRSN